MKGGSGAAKLVYVYKKQIHSIGRVDDEFCGKNRREETRSI